VDVFTFFGSVFNFCFSESDACQRYNLFLGIDCAESVLNWCNFFSWSVIWEVLLIAKITSLNYSDLRYPSVEVSSNDGRMREKAICLSALRFGYVLIDCLS